MYLTPGTIVDDCYRIERLLGAGGFAVVYEAAHLRLDRHVALKILNESVSDAVLAARFRREANILSNIRHINITTFYGFGIWQQHPYFAMELVSQESLQSWLTGSDFDCARFISIMRDVCDAMGYAHAQGIIHRDLKPGNIVLSEDARGKQIAKIIDFGLARADADSGIHAQRLTEAGTAIGSLVYMSPEQCMAQPVTAASDVYSLGIIMYHCIAGRPPFYSDHTAALMLHHITETPAPLPDLGNPFLNELRDITSKCLQKNPSDRYGDGYELLSALKATVLDIDEGESKRLNDLLSRIRSSTAEVAYRGNTSVSEEPTGSGGYPSNKDTTYGARQSSASWQFGKTHRLALWLVVAFLLVALSLSYIYTASTSQLTEALSRIMVVLDGGDKEQGLVTVANAASNLWRPDVAASLYYDAANACADKYSVDRFRLLLRSTDMLDRAGLKDEAEARYKELIDGLAVALGYRDHADSVVQVPGDEGYSNHVLDLMIRTRQKVVASGLMSKLERDYLERLLAISSRAFDLGRTDDGILFCQDGVNIVDRDRGPIGESSFYLHRIFGCAMLFKGHEALAAGNTGEMHLYYSKARHNFERALQCTRINGGPDQVQPDQRSVLSAEGYLGQLLIYFGDVNSGRKLCARSREDSRVLLGHDFKIGSEKFQSAYSQYLQDQLRFAPTDSLASEIRAELATVKKPRPGV